MSASVEEQVSWAKASALVVAAPERCVLEVVGSDRLSWLNGLLTCELLSRKEGDAVHGLAVAQKGKIVSDVIVLVLAEKALLIVQRSAADGLIASFEHHLMMEDAELRRFDGEVSFVHGPRAAAVLDAARSTGAFGGAFDTTGFGGALVVTVAGDGAAAVMGRAATEVGGGTGDAAGWNVVRVLSGVPKFGVDFDDGTYPQEAGLETKAVSFDKGCYLGQEVVCMLEMRGHVKRKLVSLAVEGSASPPPHAAVDDGKGTTIGEVTSSASMADGETRALAMVKYAFIAQGTELKVGGATARVV